MKLFLDTAEYDEVKQGVDWGVIDGVTTNPTLIAKAGQDHETQVKKICGIIGNVSAEVVSEKKDDIVVEGRRLAAWHKNVIVKVPLTPDGLAAGKVLAAMFKHPLTDAGLKRFKEDYLKSQEAKPAEAAAKR